MADKQGEKDKKIVTRKHSGKGLKPGGIKRMNLYRKASLLSPLAFKRLEQILKKEKVQDSVVVAAAKIILSKSIPDLKAVEYSGTIKHKRVLSDDEYKRLLISKGIDPKTGRRAGVLPKTASEGIPV